MAGIVKTDRAVRVYSSGSQLRHPRQLVAAMRDDMRGVGQLAWRLLLRNMRGRYRQPLLGYVWILLPPLATTVVWVLLNRSKVFQMEQTSIPYPAYVLIGTTLWQVFVDSLGAPLACLKSYQHALTKVRMPWEAVMLAGLGEIVCNAALRSVLLVAVFWMYHLPVPGTVLLAPAGIAALMLLGTAIGLWLVPPGMLYPDVERGLVLVSAFWFLITPVVYAPPSGGILALLARANPVTPLLIMTRELLTQGASTAAVASAVIAAASMALLALGIVAMRVSAPHIIVRLGAQ